jgi:hypothetical protein
MRLIDAINHAREVSESQYACEGCKQEHKQLAEWLEELKELREKDRWIPVSERLPEYGNYVLISCEGFDAPTVGKYEEDDIGGTFYLNEDAPCEDFGIVVEAWRPLPEPYKE